MNQEKKTWIYCRIDAPEDVHGMLKKQREQLIDYAEQMGFCVIGSSSDVANGVGKIRPGWEHFMQTAYEQQVDVLLVHSLSRIHLDTCQALSILEQLKRKGVTVYSPLEGKLDFAFQHIIGKMEEIK